MAMLALAKRMFERARQDFLTPDHEVRLRARALHLAYEQRFLVQPPEISSAQFVDAYVRAYAAWHVYTGEE